MCLCGKRLFRQGNYFMNRKTAKSSSVFRGATIEKPHRRPRICFSLLASYFIRGIGDWLYYFGSSVIRARRNTRRSWRRWFKGFRKNYRKSAKKFFSGIGERASAVRSDITEPIDKAKRSIKSLAVVMQGTQDKTFAQKLQRLRMFFKYGWLWNKHLVARFMNYLLPAVSAIVCLAVIISMLTLNYALEVNYNGQMIGYVTDEAVYDSAKKIIKSRMVTGSSSTWERGATLQMAVVNESELSSQDVMADSLLAVSGSEIAEATGLFVGGEFYGATTATALLEEAVNSVIAPYQEQAAMLGDEMTVKFARNVELKKGIYSVDEIVPFEELDAVVHSNESQDLYYDVKEGEKASDIANANGITLEKLTELNPGTEMELQGGERLLVAAGEPLLSVKTVRYKTYTESIGYSTMTIIDSRFPNNYFLMVTTGEEGEKTVTEEIEYRDGVEVSTTVVSEEVTKPAVNAEIIKGGKPTGDSTISIGTGSLTWPTGPTYTISRGWSSVHFGIDIASGYGTPIYAADNGVVTYTAVTDVGYGIYTIIDHQNGMTTVYAHLSANLCSVGDVVNRGELIGLMGSTGNSTGSHLHFEVRIDGEKTDPAPFLYG